MFLKLKVSCTVQLWAVFLFSCLTGCGQAPPASPQAVSSTPEKSSAAEIPAPLVATDSLKEVSLVNAQKVEALLGGAKGKTLVVNLWATWCPPCVGEMPELAKFHREMDREKVAFLSLSADDKATIEEKVKPFMKDKKLPFPVYVMDDEVAPLSRALGVKLSGALPITIVYAPDGTLKQLWEEPVTLEQLRSITAS